MRGRKPGRETKYRRISVEEWARPLWDDFIEYCLSEEEHVSAIVTDAVTSYEPFMQWRSLHGKSTAPAELGKQDRAGARQREVYARRAAR
jgi:hypothetical protein